jgi:hypothetical protein
MYPVEVDSQVSADGTDVVESVDLLLVLVLVPSAIASVRIDRP